MGRLGHEAAGEVRRPRRLLDLVGPGDGRHQDRIDDRRSLVALVRRLEVEDRSDGLAGDDPPGGEAAAVADAIDLVTHRFGGVTGADVVRPQAVGHHPVVDGGRRRAQRLGDDLAAIEATPRIARAGADERVSTMEDEIEHVRSL